MPATSEEITNPLLALIKEQSLVDDLQFEELQAEFKRTGKPMVQVIQDLGIMDLDTVLQVIADYMGTQVVKLGAKEIPPEVIKAVPASTARMYQCLPIALNDSTLQVALTEPLNPARIDEMGFIVKYTLQQVVCDP